MKVDIKWQYISKKDTLRAFDTDEFSGLDEKAVSRRSNKYGDNYIWKQTDSSPISALVKYIFDLPVLFFVTAVFVAAFNGFSPLFAVTCFLALLSAVFRFVCELMYRLSVSRSYEISIPEVRVIREGGVRIISAVGIVPGDIVLLSAGDAVPADLRVIDCDGFAVSEKSVGGEAVPIELASDVIPKGKEDRVPGNIALAGSYVVRGRAKAVCIACGGRTYAAENKISTARKAERDHGDVRRAEKLSAVASAAALLLALVYVFVGMFFHGEGVSLSEIFLSAFAFAASCGGAVYVSIVYFSRFAARLPLRKSGASCIGSSIEGGDSDIGALVINSADTLKSGRIDVDGVFVNGKYCSSDSFPQNGAVDEIFSLILLSYGIVPGQPVPMGEIDIGGDVNVISACSDYFSADKERLLRSSGIRLAGVAPRSSENLCNTSLYYDNGELNSACCGDIRTVLSLCRSICCDGYDELLSEKKKSDVIAFADSLTAKGKRVVAISRKAAPVADLSRLALLQNGMTFVGFAVISTPLADGASEMISRVNARGSGVIVFASDTTDGFLISDIEGADFNSLQISDIHGVNRFAFEKGKNYIIRAEDTDSAARIKYFLIKKLKKLGVETAYLASEADDAAAQYEACVRICARGAADFSVLPAILTASADVVVRNREDLLSAITALFEQAPNNGKYSAVRKYLAVSFALRALCLIVSLFAQNLILPIIYLIWGLFIDQTVGFCMFYQRKR